MMRKAILGFAAAVIVFIGLLLIGSLLFVPHSPAGNQIGRAPNGNEPLRAQLEFLLLGLTLGLYTALVAVMVVCARSFLRSGNRQGWLRLGLALGGIFSLYAVVSNVLGVLLPAPDDGNIAGGPLILTLPLLLTGVAGVIGGYSKASRRAGTFAGLLTGFLGLVVGQFSWVIVVALAWNALQHNLLQSGVESDFQRYAQSLGHAPDLGTFLSLELFEDGIGLPLTFGLIALILEGLCATLGGVIGAALRRADEQSGRMARPAVSTTRSAGLLLAALALGLLVWIGTAELNTLGGAHRLLGPSDLSSAFVNQNFALWVISLLIGLAFVLVSARSGRSPAAAISE